MTFHQGLAAHLASGTTTTCHAWAIRRADGVEMGFTDHDCDLHFEGLTFRADTGLSALALQQGTGLSVDNSEAIGALSDAAISEAEIEAGRYDGAELRAWLVNWARPEERQVVFRGTIGELTRAGGGFRAELRGLSEALNQPMGRVYQKSCTAVLGDPACGIALDVAGYRGEAVPVEIAGARVFSFAALPGFAPGWFARGRLVVLDGVAQGLSGAVKSDKDIAGRRVVELWSPIRADVAAGTRVALIAGCDKRAETCRLKFANFANFQGFPNIPGDDWLTVQPSQAGQTQGGSRR